MTIKTFFRSPKGLLLVILVVLTGLAAWKAGFMLVAPGLVAAVVVGMAIDAPILRLREKKWAFPSGALLTGLIVAAILSPHERWYVAAVTSAVAIASKHLFRIRTANVFNPAAFALVATYYFFDAEHSWWGAMPELSSVALLLLVATGVFITDRINKMPCVLAFLGTYYLFFGVAAFVGDPGKVAELYRAPDLHAALYFAFFMVTDPPTSPVRHRDQVVYGLITGVISCLMYALVGAAWFLLAGLLAANGWEAWRRVRARASRTRGLVGPSLHSLT